MSWIELFQVAGVAAVIFGSGVITGAWFMALAQISRDADAPKAGEQPTALSRYRGGRRR